ncbi:hypothetical protein L2E82_31519 [Cichorium intybus]|uniref:Uncharacterized protein n=1 Tax=Cichorium intybus TaxID=13427 RepID=A0ACB9BDF0_CICIN|nr:hypothetical protein L2E82_31519 [Cichorium intybus]
MPPTNQPQASMRLLIISAVNTTTTMLLGYSRPFLPALFTRSGHSDTASHHLHATNAGPPHQDTTTAQPTRHHCLRMGSDLLTSSQARIPSTTIVFYKTDSRSFISCRQPIQKQFTMYILFSYIERYCSKEKDGTATHELEARVQEVEEVYNEMAVKQELQVVIRPATVGRIQAGAFKIGDTAGTIDNIIQCKLYRPESVGIVSKCGMSNELYNTIARVTDGIYEGIAIGEIELGGRDEYSLVEALKSGKINEPVCAWVSGTCARLFKSEVQFGHAGVRSGAEQWNSATLLET